MATLKDFLGSIIAGLNQARAIADFETATLAELYAQDDKMKHFSIPRMRMQEVELTIPLAIDNLDEVKQQYQPFEKKSFAANTLSGLRNVYKVEAFKKSISTKLQQVINKETEILESRLKKGENKAVTLKQFCSKIAEMAIKNMKDSKNAVSQKSLKKAKKLKAIPAPQEVEINSEMISATLQEKLSKEIKSRDTRGMIENANVTVESDKLKEKKPESLIFIKMKISEEGMEWQTMQNEDGSLHSKLVQE